MDNLEAGITNNNPQVQPTITELFQALIQKHILNSYGKADCFIGLKFNQGGREMLQINVHSTQIPSLLKSKPSDAKNNDPLAGKNRPVDTKHATGIANYIISRVQSDKPWIIGTLTANVDKGKINIDEIWEPICLVTIPKGTFLDITDGQHRTRAIQELMMSEGDNRDLISDDYFPITLVLENDWRQCQTDFRDMAQTKSITKAQLISFGALGRDGITQELIEKVSMFNGKTDKLKQSPGRKTKFIYTSNYIARFVSYAFSNSPNQELLDFDVDRYSQILTQTLNQFFNECQYTNNIAQTESDKLKFKEVIEFKKSCILGVSVGLEILGRLLYRIYDKGNESFYPDRVYQLSQLDWSQGSELWEGNIVSHEISPKGSISYKIINNSNAIKRAITNAIERLDWSG